MGARGAAPGRTVNQEVAGSSPARGANYYEDFRDTPRSEQALAPKLALNRGGLRGREPFQAANRSAKVFGCEVRVAHRHGQRSMAEEFLQFFERYPAHD